MKRSGMNVRLTDLLYLMEDSARLLLTLRGTMVHGVLQATDRTR